LSSFRVIWGGVIFIFSALFTIVAPLAQKGLLVDVREQKVVGVEKSLWTETVSVYVDVRRGFLVNGQPVRREELEVRLKKALSRQMVWTVYLEADSECLFGDIVHAMDTIQGLGSKLVWITPKTREEWEQKNAP